MALTPIERTLSWAKSAGMSQRELADRLGCSAQDITNWKARGLPPQRYSAVAHVFGRSVDELLGRPLAEQPPTSPASRIVTAMEPIGLHDYRGAAIQGAVGLLSDAIAQAAAEEREAIATNMAGWCRSGGAEPWRGVVTTLLQSAGDARRKAAEAA